MIAILAVVSVTGASAVLAADNAGQRDPLASVVHKVFGRSAMAQPSTAVVLAPVKDVPPVHLPTLAGQPRTAASAGVPSLLVNSELNKLDDIASTLFGSLTPADWTTIAQTLAPTTSQGAAEHELADVLRRHLSGSDRAWLAEHFQGDQSFGIEDIALLQGSVSQAEFELTPAERTMLESELGRLVHTSSGTATG